MYWLIALLFCSSCGYHYSSGDEFESSRTISIPYISGDPEGLLNNELAYQLSVSGEFSCVQSGGDLVLQVVLISDTHERIGFRYDRDNPSGALEKNLLGVEDCRSVIAEVSLIESSSGKIILGPSEVRASVDYDYTDPGSPRDLLFAKTQPIMPFSLGQLDSQEGAYDDAARPLFKQLSQKIVMGVVSKLPELSF
ncbi:MAG: hypothetical protein JSS09_06500 [Verrucomicrobia bacterium]|nr:hypothetical protein [Verrucomicrobiota bacterium]